VEVDELQDEIAHRLVRPAEVLNSRAHHRGRNRWLSHAQRMITRPSVPG
jgi:hypothetical protein